MKSILKLTIFIAGVFIIALHGNGQQVGELFFLGSTVFDIQHHGSIGKTIAVDENNCIHFCWTGGFYSSVVKYNYRTPEGNFAWAGGISISSLTQTQYTSIDLSLDRLAVISYQGTFLSNLIPAVSLDQYSGGGSFVEFYIQIPETTLTNLHLAVDSRDWIHVIAYTPRISDKRALYYNRSEDDGLSWLEEWEFVDSVRVLSGCLAVSNNGKVSLAWGHPINPNYISPLEVLNNDLYYVESIDGETWDFANPVNLTDFVNGLHPNSDSLRAYEDISLLYDHQNRLHFAYTCAGFWQGGGHSNTCAGSKIYHFCDTDGFTLITGDLRTSKFPALNRRIFDRPSLGFDYSDYDLYCVWRQTSDESDTSAYGFLNGEIYSAYSEDMGASWSQSVNLSNTSSPAAEPGECENEDFPSLASIVNDTLHIEYLFDRDPSYYGTYTSDLMYQKISVDEFKALSEVNQNPDNSLPGDFSILNSHPNPFNSSTVIHFEISTPDEIFLAVYDIQGRLVEILHSGDITAGGHDFIFKAEGLSSGIYIARLRGDNWSASAKMLLIK